jgi:hypothetical protein
MGFTCPIPDRWRMCTISYSIPRCHVPKQAWQTRVLIHCRYGLSGVRLFNLMVILFIFLINERLATRDRQTGLRNYFMPDRWRMCTISYSIPRWRTAISCGQCRSSNMIYYAEMQQQTVKKLTWLKGTYYTEYPSIRFIIGEPHYR